MNFKTNIAIAAATLAFIGGYTAYVYHWGSREQEAAQVIAVAKQIQKRGKADAKIDKKVPTNGDDAAVAKFLRSFTAASDDH